LKLILLTGATGYIGGRLLRALRDSGQPVRCLARNPLALPLGTDSVAGDVLSPETLPPAFAGVSTAYYLIHSMGSTGDFEEQDRMAAKNFGEAARASGVKRIVYLGGLGAPDEPLSAHLRSRQEVGEVLRQSGVPVVEFRASIIIGSGSLSFEMVRALVERLPVMICPRWVSMAAQPIAVNDVIRYLVAAANLPDEGSVTYEIGGPDQVSYSELMKEYARQRGLTRMMIPVPILTPHLSSLWLALVTPLYARVGRKLVDSLRCPTVVHDSRALSVFPFRPKNLEEAIAEALRNEDRELAETRWSDALSSSGWRPPWGGVRFGAKLVDSRSSDLNFPVEKVFRGVMRIGGTQGWHSADFLWTLRGWIDLLIGGVGMRRGRKHPEKLNVGEALDCWRVEAVEKNHRLLLRAEMKLPGRGWLEFEVTERPEGGCTLRQTAIFEPKGLWGLLYWYGIYPAHAWIFRGMLRGLIRSIAEE